MHISKHSFAYKEKGVSLIETVVAMFIFVIMMTSMIGVFTVLIHKRSDTKQMQQRTEEFSLAMSYVTKKMRMSDIESPGDCNVTKCKVIDHGASSMDTNVYSTFEFKSIDGTLTEAITTETLNTLTHAVINRVTDPDVIIATHITGGFVVGNVNKIPTITIHMMSNAPGSGSRQTSVQTTVSLRSYK